MAKKTLTHAQKKKKNGIFNAKLDAQLNQTLFIW